jgi:hypothetical protein
VFRANGPFRGRAKSAGALPNRSKRAARGRLGVDNFKDCPAPAKAREWSVSGGGRVGKWFVECASRRNLVDLVTGAVMPVIPWTRWNLMFLRQQAGNTCDLELVDLKKLCIPAGNRAATDRLADCTMGKSSSNDHFVELALHDGGTEGAPQVD